MNLDELSDGVGIFICAVVPIVITAIIVLLVILTCPGTDTTGCSFSEETVTSLEGDSQAEGEVVLQDNELELRKSLANRQSELAIYGPTRSLAIKNMMDNAKRGYKH